ncbi:class I SAM-dependent methyltransferase [Halomonas sp. BC1]|uniref:class I SAM-dependent methyltransferase n=1 Tax=Halomonas sp. BC1 TaxID=1670448 RepID=UPI0009C16010|nr:class I SAM-dependent methyltransferase [Halomonas sp. BC1]
MSHGTYYERSKQLNIYPHLRESVERLPGELPRTAIDMGCGAGRNALFLVEHGYRVHAFDHHPLAIERLQEEGKAHLGLSLFTSQARFDEFEYPPASLITACMSLFFCHPDVFPTVWHRLTQSLSSGGMFCGHFMGPDDTWAQDESRHLTIHTPATLSTLFADDYHVITLQEQSRAGMTLMGKNKHWHTYSAILQKR